MLFINFVLSYFDLVFNVTKSSRRAFQCRVLFIVTVYLYPIVFRDNSRSPCSSYLISIGITTESPSVCYTTFCLSPTHSHFRAASIKRKLSVNCAHRSCITGSHWISMSREMNQGRTRHRTAVVPIIPVGFPVPICSHRE